MDLLPLARVTPATAARDNDAEALSAMRQPSAEALVEAAKHDSAEAASALLRLDGTDPDARDGQGFTALMYACMYGSERVARVLVDEAGADFRATNDQGLGALELAAKHNQPATCRLVLRAPKRRNQPELSVLRAFEEAGGEEAREVLRADRDAQAAARAEAEERRRRREDVDLREFGASLASAESHVRLGNARLAAGDAWTAWRHFAEASALFACANWSRAADAARADSATHFRGTVLGFTCEDVDRTKERAVRVEVLDGGARVEVEYAATIGYVLRQRRVVRTAYRRRHWRVSGGTRASPYELVLRVDGCGGGVDEVVDGDERPDRSRGDTTVRILFPDPRRREPGGVFTQQNQARWATHLAALVRRVKAALSARE